MTAAAEVGPVIAWPADEVCRMPVADLIPYVGNARTHSKKQVAQIAASIVEWGWTTPILVDEGGAIIAGHGRVMAAQKLNIPEIPVMVARGWTEAQKRAYVLADNQLPMNAGWDDDILRVEIKAIEGLHFDIGKIGFDTEALAKLFDVGGVNIAPDEGEGASGVQMQYLRFDEKKIVITDDELAGLNDLFARYTDEFGLSHGFAQWIVDGLHVA